MTLPWRLYDRAGTLVASTAEPYLCAMTAKHFQGGSIHWQDLGPLWTDAGEDLVITDPLGPFVDQLRHRQQQAFIRSIKVAHRARHLPSD